MTNEINRLVNAAETVLENIKRWRGHPMTDKPPLEECRKAEAELRDAANAAKRALGANETSSPAAAGRDVERKGGDHE
jgi:hypothetical protein